MTFFSVCTFHGVVIKCNIQHLLPIRSVLHHDDPSYLPHINVAELYHPGKELEIPSHTSTVGGREGGRESF